MLKSLKKFLLSDLFIRNFLYSFVCLLVFVFLTLFALKIFTKHNRTIKVPNLIGLDDVGLDSAILENKKFRYEIIDSIYDYGKTPGSVYTQIPHPFSNVKKNRKIYLTIVAKNQRNIIMPKLKDLTYRSAKDKIEALNLIVGEIIYVPDIAHNTVLRIKVNGEDFYEGMIIQERSVIDFILGNGKKGIDVIVPNLIGLNYVLASDILKDNLLNFHVHYNEDFELDSLYVVDQNPFFDGENTLKQGRYVDLYLDTMILVDSTFIK